jgi:hypothetical protein
MQLITDAVMQNFEQNSFTPEVSQSGVPSINISYFKSPYT